MKHSLYIKHREQLISVNCMITPVQAGSSKTLPCRAALPNYYLAALQLKSINELTN